MSDHHDTQTAASAAHQFSEMARKITENAGNGFCGAVVAFPPSGDPFQLLLIANQGDEALFWGTLKTQIEIRLGQLADQQSGRGMGQWR